MSETRKIAAILVGDIVGYSRLAGADEDRTLSRLRGLRSDLIDPAIAAHHGRIVKRTGDGILIEFRSVVDAVRTIGDIVDQTVGRVLDLFDFDTRAFPRWGESSSLLCEPRRAAGPELSSLTTPK